MLSTQDEVAHRFATDAKGHAGTKLCLACMNVLSHRSARLPCPNGYCVSSASLDQSSFKLHTDASVRAALARLNDVERDVVRGDVLQSELDLMQQEFGFNANKESFIVDMRLRANLHIPARLDAHLLRQRHFQSGAQPIDERFESCR